MNSFDEHFGLPSAPAWQVDWTGLDERFAWIRAMQGAVQDAEWHAEGDVWIHTKLVCEALASLPAWRALDLSARRVVWLGALLHDVAKPYSTQHEDGRVRSRHHSPRGALHARRLLWQAGLAPHEREAVCGLVRHHQLPLHTAFDAQFERRLSAASLRCRLRDLALVAEADIRGRTCDDQAGKLDTIELFGELARELDCWDEPRPFPSDHTRVLYFRGERPATAPAHDDRSSTVFLLSGLPGAGKSHWRRERHPSLPAVCLDDIRVELGVDAAADQGRVRQAAQDRARTFLRDQRDFVWDATNLDAARRRRIIDLCFGYGARIALVGVEAPSALLHSNNARRQAPVPQRVVDSMLQRWSPPDATEGHTFERVVALGVRAT